MGLFSNVMFLAHHVCALPYCSHTLCCCLPSFLPVLQVYFLKASSYQTSLFIVVLEVLWVFQIPSHSRTVLWLLHGSSQLMVRAGEGIGLAVASLICALCPTWSLQVIGCGLMWILFSSFKSSSGVSRVKGEWWWPKFSGVLRIGPPR